MILRKSHLSHFSLNTRKKKKKSSTGIIYRICFSLYQPSMAKEIINLNYLVEVALLPLFTLWRCLPIHQGLSLLLKRVLRNTIMIHNLECFLFIFFCLGYLKSCLHFKGYENSDLCWAEVYIIIYPKRRRTILMLQTIGGSDLEP